MDVIVKSYVEKIVKEAIYNNGRKPSEISKTEFDNVVKKVIKADPIGVKRRAYKDFNS